MVERTLSDAGHVDDGIFETDFANVDLLAGWVLRQNGRAVPLEPVELVDAVATALSTLADAHDGGARRRQDRSGRIRDGLCRSARPGPLHRSVFGVLQALLAHLLAACGDERSATLDAADVAAAFSIPLEELRDHLAAQPRELRRRLLRRLRGA